MSQVRFGQSGYCGSSRSIRAAEAEIDGRFPLTRAIPVVAAEAGVTRKVARAALIATHDGEWHHTGKYAARTAYYSVDTALAHIAADARFAAPVEAALREEIEDAESTEERGGDVNEHPENVVHFYWDGHDWKGEGAGPGHVGEARLRRYGFNGDTIADRCAASLQHAANFRYWEAAIRRLATV